MTKESVGEFLKRERELRQITLEEVAEGTKISIRRLRSIEADQFDDLPAEVFVRGFIRSYAEYIGIDPTDALLRLEENLPQDELDIRNVRRFSSPTTDVRRSRSPLLLFVAVGAAILILAGAWYFFFQNQQVHIPSFSHTKAPSRPSANSSSITYESNSSEAIGPQILLEQETETQAAGSGNGVETHKALTDHSMEDKSR